MAGEKISAGTPSSMFQTVFASTALAGAATTSGSKITSIEKYTCALFQAEVTSVSGTSPTVNIYIQTLLPDGTTWQDIASFTQIVTTAHRILWFVSGAPSEAAIQTAALTAGSIKAIGMGGAIRATVVVGGTNPAATVVVYGSFFE